MGIYCNDINHCIYFDSTTCIVDKAIIRDYEIRSKREIEIKGEDKSITYEYELDENKLRLREHQEEPFSQYARIPTINKHTIENLSFSSHSDLADIELYISDSDEVQLRINNHSKFEAGNFKGELPKTLMNFINQLANTVEFDMSSELKNEIVSDVQEWGLKIKLGEEHFLYHNYVDINQNHHNLAFLLQLIPYFIELEKADKLLEHDEIKEFRESEFRRNIEKTIFKRVEEH